MLWVLVLSLCGALIAALSGAMPQKLRADTLSMQGLLGAAFLLFILLTSNPFARLPQPPWEGNDLNPILQDPGLAIHPPLLYLGYVGYSIVFSFAAAALVGGRIDAAWARYARPWGLFAWVALTLGIAMGSYWPITRWAGRLLVLGPGRERLAHALARLHRLHPQRRRDGEARSAEGLDDLSRHSRLLAVAARTFLVRSGVLTSVHAFASDPERGVFILAILVLFIGGALALFALRAGSLPVGGLFAPISREGALVVNNLLLSACCFTVVVGTLYPLALEAPPRDKISVGAPLLQHGDDPHRFAAGAADAGWPDAGLEARRRTGRAQRLRAAFALGVLAAALLAFGSERPGCRSSPPASPSISLSAALRSFWCGRRRAA